MKLAIIANPVAGRGRPYRKVTHWARHWPHAEWEVEILPTRGPEHAGEIALELLSRPPDLLAVCGGDGTIHEVASRVPNPPFTVALLPAGTSNVLARELGLPLDPSQALDIALAGIVRRVDLGVLRARTEQRFLLMTGVGLDAYVAAKVRPRFKNAVGIASYYLAAAQCLLSYPFAQFQVVTDRASVSATSCVVANAKGYGGDLVLTPGADMSDGILDILTLQTRSRLDYLKFLFSAWRGCPRRYPWVGSQRARAVKIEGPRGLWVQADGELVGTLPLDISLSPSVFPLVFPA